MKISVVVEADYEDLHDQKALTREALADSINIIAARVEDDFKHRRSEHKTYGTFYQIYKMDAGAKRARERSDDTAQQVLKLAVERHPASQ